MRISNTAYSYGGNLTVSMLHHEYYIVPYEYINKNMLRHKFAIKYTTLYREMTASCKLFCLSDKL